MFYDEVETFRDHKDDQFKYPYGSRKTLINSLILDPKKFDRVVDNNEVKIDTEINYEFTTQYIKLQVS